MKVFVGLGNKGIRYDKTRHNVGFLVVDSVLQKLEVETHFVKKYDSLVYYLQSRSILFVKPQTMMNNSGKAVSTVVRTYKVDSDNLYVIFDDLDIVLGEYKIQKGKGPKDHNGINSIYDIGIKDFWHVRIGIDGKDRKDIAGEDYVLQKFPDDELKIARRILDKVSDRLLSESAYNE